jgi:integrase
MSGSTNVAPTQAKEQSGEVLGLHVEDVDLDAREMHIRGAMQYQKGRGNIVVPTKTSASEAPLPIPDVLVPVLREHLAMLEEERTYSKWKEQGLLFPTAKGTPISARNLVRHFKLMLGRAGLPDVRFHDLRHSCATLLITQGVHPRIVMEILRHTQISTTMNIYAHAIPEVNRGALNSLGDLLKPQTMSIPRRVKKDDEKR